MDRSTGLFFIVAAILLAGAAESAVRRSPPLFRDSVTDGLENPNSRFVPQPRADDLDYRLPNHTMPEHYEIELTTNVHTGEKAFTGKVVIDIVIVEATNQIVLHARQTENFVATIVSATGGTAETLTVEYEAEREFLTLTRATATPFAKDSKWKLTITYNGQLRTDNGGFYLSTYTDENGVVHSLATTQFESTDARHAFPCYDEPAKRAQFTITINHDPSYTAICNMPVNTAASSSGKTVFQRSVSMPTYIVAFIVSDFQYTEGVLNGLPQRIYSRPGTVHEQEWALVSGMLITARLAEYYGVEFMLPKLDQAAIPDFAAGAMENYGLATYREEYMLYNTETSTVNTQTNIASIIAHEYCHQWFGDYVAIEWWTYLWLKEGFASLFAVKAVDAAYPEWGIWQQFHTDDYQNALVRDGSNNPRPMTHYVQKPNEISSLYDSVSYAKAGSVLNMWGNALTDKVFQQGLHNYLTVNQFSSAVEEKLFEAIQTAAKEMNYAIPAEIALMMGSWSNQGGFPLLTVTRNYNDGTFTIKQEAFNNEGPATTQKTWYIPTNYVAASNPDFRDTEATHYLLNVPEIKVEAKLSSNDWLILNKQSTGYYRINYDEKNWHLIVDGLINRPYKIHPRNRAQLMHDAYRFSASNRLSHSILMNMLTYLKDEDQYAPWSTANSIITTYNRYLSGDAEYENFKFFISELVGPIYEKLGVNDNAGDHHMQKFTRNVVINLACLAGIKSCLEETNNKLKGLVNDNTPIEPNLQTQIYCNGLKQSGNNEFDFVYNKLMDSDDQALRRSLISSLGCAQKEDQIMKFISSSIDTTNKLRTQERTTLLSPAYSRGEVGLLTSIDFLNNNWEAYADLVSGFGGANPLDSDVRGMASYVTNKNQEEKLLALVTKIKDSPKVSATLEEAVKTSIKANFDWLDINRDPLMLWVANKYKKDDGSASITASAVTIVTAVVLLVSRLF